MSIARDQRCRELFPLPDPPTDEHSREAHGKFAKREKLAAQRSVDAVVALNTLISDTGLRCDGPPTAGSYESSARVAEIIGEFTAGWDPVSASKESVAQVLGSSLGYDGEEVEAQHMGSYDRDILALPSARTPPVGVETMVDEHARKHVVAFEDLILRSDSEFVQGEDVKPPRPYWDPRLANSRRRYIEFILDLAEHQIIGFTQRPAQEVGCFFVKKKDGRLRLIVDARATNHRCRRPPSMRIGGTASWSAIKVPAGEQLWTAQYDVEAYFYRLGIEADIGRYFSLMQVPEWVVHKYPTCLDHVEDGLPWYPYFRVIPMGWSWAMWLAQRVHVEAHVRAGLSPACIVIVGRPAPTFGKRDCHALL